jgi:alkylated DNA nucleotide flippase Atl1
MEVGELLVQLLRDRAQEGRIVTYQDLNELTGLDVQKARSVIYTAMKKVLQDYGYSFKCVPRKGYQPIEGIDAVVMTGERSRKKITNITTKWRDNYQASDPSKMDQSSLNKYIREGCLLNVAETITSAKTMERVDLQVGAAIEDHPLSHKNMKKIQLACFQALAGVG